MTSRMHSWVALAFVLLTAALAATADSNWDKPWFCHDLDCPPFKTLQKTDEYEVREYAPSFASWHLPSYYFAASAHRPALRHRPSRWNGHWVGTRVEGHKWELATAFGFKNLYKYLDGGNEEQKKYDMTVPLVSTFHPLNGFRASEQNYTFAIYVPCSEEEAAPKPTLEEVSVKAIPRMKLFVRDFGGYAFESSVLDNAGALFDALKNDGVEFQEDLFVYGSYDPPHRLWNRHNEVAFWSLRTEPDAALS